jgi:hypothetical protein
MGAQVRAQDEQKDSSPQKGGRNEKKGDPQKTEKGGLK